MIIQPRGASLLLITQPDHAALSAEIMRHWRDKGLVTHPRRESVLLAIREHDNGWREVDERPLVSPSGGALLDFLNAPGEVRRDIWPRAVERLAHDPWAAALVAQHAIHIYRRYRGDSAWDEFFVGLEAARASHLGRVDRLGLEDLLADYPFVRLGDLVSLTFCNGWSEGPEQPGYAMRLRDERLTVTPDPFGGAKIRLSVRAREVPNRPFESEAEAARVFNGAPVVRLCGVFAGAG